MAETDDYHGDAASSSAEIDLLLRNISKLPNVAFFVWNEDNGRPIYVSGQLPKFYRMSMAEFLERFGTNEKISANMVGADGERYLAATRAAMAAAGSYEVEFRFHRADRTICFAREVGEYIWDADAGRVLRSVGALIDITALKETEHELQESLEHQTATSEVLNVIGRSPTNLQPVMDVIARNAARVCAATDAHIFRVDGDALRLVASFQPELPSAIVREGGFPLVRGTATGRAVLERRSIHVADLAAELDTEYPDARPYQQSTGHRTLLATPLLREGVPVGVFVLARNRVEPFADEQIRLVATFADQAVIAIENLRLFDEVQARTRELTRSLQELHAAQDRLVNTEKLASLGQLTAGIAHEIKNPLNFVNNFSALSVELIDELRELLAGAALDRKIRAGVDELTDMLKGNLGKVVEHGKRADSIVKNMLLHSRQGSGEHRPVDINAVVEESLNLAYHGARAERPGFNITLQKAFDPQAGSVDLFPQEITRVLLNLISNGFYATVKRSASANGAYEPVLAASTRNLGDHVEISIRDNGTGIAAEVRKQMFNPFFTTKPAGEGTGLGLSLSHDIVVKQHGGTIEVDTEPGQFTEFRIVLPRRAASLAVSGGPA